MLDSESSESEDEYVQKLKEAVAQELVSCMKSRNSDKTNHTQHTDVPKSVRNQLYSTLIADENELKTTPEFRQHVSKKLASYLESIIMWEEPNLAQVSTSSTGEGIKLLSSSTEVLGSSNKDVDPLPLKAFSSTARTPASNSSDSDSDSEMQRLCEAAVSGGDVLKGGEGAFRYSGHGKSNKRTKKQKRSSGESNPNKKKAKLPKLHDGT